MQSRKNDGETVLNRENKVIYEFFVGLLPFLIKSLFLTQHCYWYYDIKEVAGHPGSSPSFRQFPQSLNSYPRSPKR